jgi:phage baseplate assembly protein W
VARVSYSLAVQGGDLVQQGSQLGLVFGVDKLRQDVQLWMTERYGGDRFHVNMGSILQDFIGGIASESTRAELQAEVLRVLQNYQALQVRKFQDSPQSLSASELLVAVDDILAVIRYDTVNVAVKLRNGSQQYTTIKVVSSTT